MHQNIKELFSNYQLCLCYCNIMISLTCQQGIICWNSLISYWLKKLCQAYTITHQRNF